MEGSPLRVVVAGGGVAGLETLMGVRGLAADHVDLTLVAPEDEFVYKPLTVEEPFSVGRVRRVALRSAAEEVDASFLSATVEEVDAGARIAVLSSGERIPYDALVLAVGAEATPAFDGVMTWDDRSDAEVLGGLLEDVEQGYAERLAVVIPPGPGWPLRGFELALLITQRAYGMSVEVQTTVVRPEPSPLAMLGERADAAITSELERAKIAIAPAERISIERGHRIALVLQPSGQRLEVNRVLAMPILRGRGIDGTPVDSNGLVPIDPYCRVADMEQVWAAGDCTAFPLKSGGFSAEQADVAAADIAATAGVDIEPRPFDPHLGEQLAGLPAGRFIEQRLAAEDPGLSLHLPSTGVPVLTYLEKDLAAGWRGRG